MGHTHTHTHRVVADALTLRPSSDRQSNAADDNAWEDATRHAPASPLTPAAAGPLSLFCVCVHALWECHEWRGEANRGRGEEQARAACVCMWAASIAEIAFSHTRMPLVPLDSLELNRIDRLGRVGLDGGTGTGRAGSYNPRLSRLVRSSDLISHIHTYHPRHITSHHSIPSQRASE